MLEVNKFQWFFLLRLLWVGLNRSIIGRISRSISALPAMQHLMRPRYTAFDRSYSPVGSPWNCTCFFLHKNQSDGNASVEWFYILFRFFLTWGSAEITVVLQLFARLHMHASFVLSIGIAATFDLKNEASSHQQQQLVAQGPKFGVVMFGLLLVRSGSTKRWW